MKIVITNKEGAMIRNYPDLKGNVIGVAYVSKTFTYKPTDADILGWYEVMLPSDKSGYINKNDAEIIEDIVDFTEIELKYLVYLLKYAEEELYVYSANFLDLWDVKLEDVDTFISDLRRKLREAEYK